MLFPLKRRKLLAEELKMVKTSWKSRRRLLLGVTGGIAAYKIPELVRAFVRRDWDVEVILTAAAERFVSPLTLSVLSGKRAWTEKDFFSDERGHEIPHIRLAQNADVVAVAPCTATTLARLACAEGSSLLTAAILATRAPVLLFPSMNTDMWFHNGVQKSCRECTQKGYTVIEPGRGPLACRDEGEGRLPSLEVVQEEILRAVCPDRNLEGLRVLVTAGPTHEYLDPVRYLSNPSSGKMGYALAKTAWYRGADVTLVSGPVGEEPPHGVNVVPVVSAGQMLDAVVKASENADIIVKAAAVGDYRAASRSAQKIKRDRGSMTVDLVPNPDILAELSKKRKKGQTLVGFAAETQDILENAAQKLASKGADLIAVNDLNAPGSGFAADTNEVAVLDATGVLGRISGSKDDVAEGLWDLILQRHDKQP